MKAYLKLLAATTAASVATAPALAQNTASASSTATLKIVAPLTITAGTVLAFGTVVKPATGSYTITVDTAGSHASSTANSYLPSSPATTAASFSITGEPSQAASITVGTAGVMTMNGPSASTLSVTLTSSKASTTLPSGSDSFTVGGSFTLTSAQTTGVYTGTLTAVVTYN
ncbi:protein of unknown function [Sphingomonas sp. YR710]|jgi:hypothetical protein|uniref:DUF4402 domain-containing protein n=1 Tax=Sphingomonas sp. YR710 TaxID=1882773 RepID=UPI0008800AAB|nr:DUF4402 domain-containing protein [Sphingomonas sp. YR710]SDC44431.1 protein of unknown function [Sphingomonas sp. YR710]